MVVVDVGDQAVGQVGRRAHGPLGHHTELAHLAASAPPAARGQPGGVTTTTRVTRPPADRRRERGRRHTSAATGAPVGN